MPGTSKEGLRILSLDGGGIVALSELALLAQILYRHGHQDKPAGHQFDLIGGSGAGGLFAILLGPLSMTVGEAESTYVKIIQDIFKDDQDTTAQEFEKHLKAMIKDKLGDEDAQMYDPSRKDICRSFVCSVPVENTAKPRLFRTYATPSNPSDNCKIWEAIRATMASVTPVEIGSSLISERFMTGSIQYNNPIHIVMDEAKQIWGCRSPEEHEHAAILLSIGAGVPEVISLSRNHSPEELEKTLKAITTDASQAHKKMLLMMEDMKLVLPPTTSKRPPPKQKTLYYRFNVEKGLHNISDYNAGNDVLGMVMTHTIHYMKEHYVNIGLEGVNEALTLRRRVWKFPSRVSRF